MKKASVYGTVFSAAGLCVAVSAMMLMYACNRKKADAINLPQAVAPIEIQRITDCHKQHNIYPSQIVARIEGTWVLQSVACSMSGTQSADKQVVVTFNDGGLYKVFESSRLVSEGSWTLSRSGDDMWEISTSLSTPYLHGQVLLCNGELVFYSSYLDGCDHYYVKR